MKKFTSILLTVFACIIMLCGCIQTDGVVRGERTETGYTNASIEVTFAKPTAWRFYTDEEIAVTMNVAGELYKDKDLINSAEITSVMEFIAADANGNNINLCIENLRPSGNKDITVEEYAVQAKELISQQVQGMTYSFGETAEATLGGQAYLRVNATCKYAGVSMKQYMYMRKVGYHMVVITASSVGSMDAEDFEKMFS